MNCEELKLEDVILLEDKKRKPLSTMERVNKKGIYPYYGAQEIIDYVNDYIFDGKYILLAEDGENLKSRKKSLVKIVEGKFWLNNHAHIFKTKDNVDLNYLYYYLLKLDLSEYITGSTQPKLNQENMYKIKIKLPKLDIQHKISHILSNIDEKIKLNNQINVNLHELVNCMYKSMFKNKIANLDRLGNHVKCVLGGTPSRNKKEYWNGNINWINSGEVNEFRIIKPSEKITELGLKNSSTTLMPKGTTVIAITGATLGQVSRLEMDSCANQSVVGIIGNKDLTNNYIYLCILNNIADITKSQTGGAQQHINKKNIEDFMIYIPSKRELNEFEHKVNNMFDKIALNCKENQTLEQLRDTFLPKLMNGEIDLENVEI